MTPAAPEDLRARVAAHLEVRDDELLPDALLGEDLGVDSLAAVELAMELEDVYGIRLPDDVLAEVRTYGDLEATVARATAAR